MHSNLHIKNAEAQLLGNQGDQEDLCVERCSAAQITTKTQNQNLRAHTDTATHRLGCQSQFRAHLPRFLVLQYHL